MSATRIILFEFICPRCGRPFVEQQLKIWTRRWAGKDHEWDGRADDSPSLGCGAPLFVPGGRWIETISRSDLARWDYLRRRFDEDGWVQVYSAPWLDQLLLVRGRRLAAVLRVTLMARDALSRPWSAFVHRTNIIKPGCRAPWPKWARLGWD